MLLDVNQPTLFVYDPSSAQAVAHGIATEIEVPTSSAHVALALNTRRLAEPLTLRLRRRLQYGGSVVVSYTITLSSTESLTDASGNNITVASIYEQMTAAANDPVVRNSFGSKILEKVNEQFGSGAYSVVVTGATAPTVVTQHVTTITTTANGATSIPIRGGLDSFAHKQAVIGLSHALVVIMVALSWLK